MREGAERWKGKARLSSLSTDETAILMMLLLLLLRPVHANGEDESEKSCIRAGELEHVRCNGCERGGIVKGL